MFAESAGHMAALGEVVSGGRSSSAPLRRPEDREEYRRSLHKSSSPHWKGAYRERCKKRLRASREKFLTRFRHITVESTNEGEDPISRGSLSESPIAVGVPSHSAIASSVQEVMMEEWEHVRTEYGNLPQIPQTKRSKFTHTATNLTNCSPSTSVTSSNAKDREKDDSVELESGELESDIELVLSVMDELTEELIREEQALMDQYEADVRFSEDALCAAIQSLSTDDVVCPVCQKSFLHQNKHIIFCSCGLRLDMAHDGISLSYMKKQLDHYSLEHSSQCRGKPSFSLESVVHTQTIIMSCAVCSFMEIIV